MLATVVTKIQERSPLKYNFAGKLGSLDPRLIIAEPDTAVNMLKQVLIKVVDTNWPKTEEAEGILTECKKSVSEMKQFHCEKFVGLKFGVDRLDAFFCDILNTQKTC